MQVSFVFGLLFNWLSDLFSFLYRPERWADIPDAAASVSGVWANVMTFIGGPRACNSFRFFACGVSNVLFPWTMSGF